MRDAGGCQLLNAAFCPAPSVVSIRLEASVCSTQKEASGGSVTVQGKGCCRRPCSLEVQEEIREVVTWVPTECTGGPTDAAFKQELLNNDALAPDCAVLVLQGGSKAMEDPPQHSAVATRETMALTSRNSA